MNERMKEIIFDSKEYLKIRNYEWKFKVRWALPLFILLLLIDVVTKQIAFHCLDFGVTTKFWPKVINFSLVYNSGIAFGINQNNLAVTIPIAIIVCLIALTLFLYLNNKIFIISVLFIFTGGLGNLIDRIWNGGRVVDFIAWVWFPPYSIFNFADIWVNCGIIILIFGIIYLILKEVYCHFKANKQIENNENYQSSIKAEKKNE